MSGFPSLGGGDFSSSADDSFWPSFTDIMMVIVMIFLISTVFLLLKNWELISELRASIEAERTARMKISATTAENLSLEERVAALEGLLNQAQLDAKRERERALSAEARADSLLTTLTATRQESAQRAERVTAVSRENQALQEQLGELQRSLMTAQAELEQQTQLAELSSAALGEARETLAKLSQQSSSQQEALQSLSAEKVSLQRTLGDLTDDYSHLKTRYNKLIKPARTTKDKQIVAVRYDKNGSSGMDELAIKPPGANSFENLSMGQLHETLSALKEKLGDQLYVRIIFPEGNNLSYEEALKFTTDLLNNYDYYYQ